MPRPRSVGVAIRVFLADGRPEGLRIVERLGWTGLCLAFARADYQVVRLRNELGRTGVYILIGEDAEGSRSTRAYVGEGETVRTRLDQHFKEKDFWSDAYVFTTTDNSLNKAQIRYLESRLLGLAREADLAALDNGTAPPPSWLSEPDVAVMDSYLDYGLALLPLLGVSMFELVDEPSGSTVDSAPEDDAASSGVETLPIRSDAPRPLLYLNTVLTTATGRDESRGFVVFQGAKSRKDEGVMTKGYQDLRHRLIADGSLAPLNDQQYELVRNVVFGSPSAAASVLAGGSKNGTTEWKNEAGRTLKELEVSSLNPVPTSSEDASSFVDDQLQSSEGGEDGAAAPPAAGPPAKPAS